MKSEPIYAALADELGDPETLEAAPTTEELLARHPSGFNGSATSLTKVERTEVPDDPGQVPTNPPGGRTKTRR